MQQILRKLSRRERALALAAGVALLVLVALFYLVREQAGTQEEMVAQERRARLALRDAQERADVTALEKQKAALQQAVGNVPSLKADSGDVTLKLWDSAGSSGVNLRGFQYTPQTATIGGVTLARHGYILQLRGDPQGLKHFLQSTTSAYYATTVDSFSLTFASGANAWDMNLEMGVHSLE